MVEHLPSTSKVLGSIPITEGREGAGGKSRAGAGERREGGEEEKEKRRKRAIEMVISHLPACSPKYPSRRQQESRSRGWGG